MTSGPNPFKQITELLEPLDREVEDSGIFSFFSPLVSVYLNVKTASRLLSATIILNMRLLKLKPTSTSQVGSRCGVICAASAFLAVAALSLGRRQW